MNGNYSTRVELFYVDTQNNPTKLYNYPCFPLTMHEKVIRWNG